MEVVKVVLEQILTAILAGLTYSLTMYFKKLQKGESFDLWKLASTIVIGIFVAVSLVLSGAEINQLTFEQQFLMYAGLIPIVENILKAIYRRFR